MKIQFGLAKRIINPEVPVSLSGYFDVRIGDHIWDDIEVRAVVFKQGSNFAAVVHFDLRTVTLKLCDEILAALAQAGVRELTRKNITFSAIHPHTAPEIRSNLGDNPQYTATLVKKSCEALAEALNNLHGGELLGGILLQQLGADSMVGTIIGTSGNINHFDVATAKSQTSYAEAEHIGSGYAATIQEAQKNLQPHSGSMMHTLFQEVVVPPREIDPQDILDAQATISKYAKVEITSPADMTSEALAAGAPAVLKYFAEKLLEQAQIQEKSHFI